MRTRVQEEERRVSGRVGECVRQMLDGNVAGRQAGSRQLLPPLHPPYSSTSRLRPLSILTRAFDHTINILIQEQCTISIPISRMRRAASLCLRASARVLLLLLSGFLTLPSPARPFNMQPVALSPCHQPHHNAICCTNHHHHPHQSSPSSSSLPSSPPPPSPSTAIYQDHQPSAAAVAHHQ